MTLVKGNLLTTLDYLMRKKGEPSPDPISVRLDADQIVEVEQLARGERISRNAMFRKLIDESLRGRAGGKIPPAPIQRTEQLPPQASGDLLEVASRISEIVERYGGRATKEKKSTSSR